MNKQELKNLLAQAMGTKLEAPIYLASGFFTEVQKRNLTEFETLLERQGKNFYSPRNHTVDFAGSANRPAIIEEIFNSNVENIIASEKAHFFLDTSAGSYDLGTVWELGFAIGNYIKSGKNIANLVLHLENDGTEFVFESIKDNLAQLAVQLVGKSRPEIPAKTTALICKDNVVNAQDTIQVLGYNMDYINLNSLLANVNDLEKMILDHSHLLFVVDNRPYQSTALMGLCYAFGFEYKTASLRGFGSNVMIAASSKGHIQLPGFYDEKKVNKVIN